MLLFNVFVCLFYYKQCRCVGSLFERGTRYICDDSKSLPVVTVEMSMLCNIVAYLNPCRTFQSHVWSR